MKTPHCSELRIIIVITLRVLSDSLDNDMATAYQLTLCELRNGPLVLKMGEPTER